MFKVPVRRGTMKEMIQAVKDLEAKGYDYITPIKRVYRTEKTFYHDGTFKGNQKIRFTGMDEEGELNE
ncbi:hypothetical protein [Bacillus sp. BP-3]|uniref:hypothetical protein n=1 Tax=Bacillus sp. BP-3 TaxID=3022773 RepID=UPI00232CD6A1|nr:hypothetical protein [Bacillus sp. BP-3]MDC2867528.1 hypothetical protein [Bacillus sp. BP-3]